MNGGIVGEKEEREKGRRRKGGKERREGES